MVNLAKKTDKNTDRKFKLVTENMYATDKITTEKTAANETSDKDIKIIKGNLDKLERALVCADENGLFRKEKNGPKFMEIIENMADALKVIENKEIPKKDRVRQAWKSQRFANHQYYQAIHAESFWWRFNYLFGGPFLIYFFTILGFTFFAWFFFDSSSLNREILLVPIWAYLWGLVGGILQGFWFLWQHVNDRRMRKAWIPWYILLPFMGAILGALMYLVFSAGFIAATGESELKSKYIVIVLSALAGFSTRWAVTILDKLTELFQIKK